MDTQQLMFSSAPLDMLDSLVILPV